MGSWSFLDSLLFASNACLPAWVLLLAMLGRTLCCCYSILIPLLLITTCSPGLRFASSNQSSMCTQTGISWRTPLRRSNYIRGTQRRTETHTWMEKTRMNEEDSQRLFLLIQPENPLTTEFGLFLALPNGMSTVQRSMAIKTAKLKHRSFSGGGSINR